MDILKILGSKSTDGSSAVPVNIKVAFDPTVNQAIKTSTRGLTVALSILSAGIVLSAVLRSKTNRRN